MIWMKHCQVLRAEQEGLSIIRRQPQVCSVFYYHVFMEACGIVMHATEWLIDVGAYEWN
jgi:hypothetical protein